MIATFVIAGFLLCAFAQPPHGNASFSATKFFTDITGYGPCPPQHCEEMLRTGQCNNVVHFVYPNQNCRCDCNGLRNGVVQTEIPIRIIVEGLRNDVAGSGLPRDGMAAGMKADTGSGIFGSRLSGNPIGMNANTVLRSGIIRHGLPLDGSRDHFQASIGNAAGGKEFPFNGGIGVNVGTGIDNGVFRRGLPLNGISMDIGVGTVNGLVDGGLSPIGLGGDFSTGIGQGIFERRVPAISIGEAGTGMLSRRGVVRNDRIIDGGFGTGIESGVAQSGLRRNHMVPGIRADIGSRLLGSILPGNSIGMDVERGIMNGLIGLGLPLDDIGGAGVSNGAGGMELTLNGGVGVAVGSGMGNGVIINELPPNGVIGDDTGSGISIGVAESGLPLNGIGMDFRVGTGEAMVGRGLSAANIGGDVTSGIGHGIVGRGILANGNREVETLLGSMEPGRGSSWNGIRVDVGDGLLSGVGGSGLSVNAVGGNVATGIGHGAHGSEWSPNSINANIGHGTERAIFGGLFPVRVESEYGPRWMPAPIGNPTVFHTGSMFIGKKATYWKKLYFAKYPRRYYPKYYSKHNLRRKFF